MKETLKTETPKIKQQLEINLSEVVSLLKTSEKILKGIKSFEKEEKIIIKTLSYVSKINKTQKEMRILFQELMKNLKISSKKKVLLNMMNIISMEYLFQKILNLKK